MGSIRRLFPCLGPSFSDSDFDFTGFLKFRHYPDERGDALESITAWRADGG